MGILVKKLTKLRDDAETLDGSCDNIYGRILNVQPFEGPELEKKLRRLESDVTRYIRNAETLLGSNLSVSQNEAYELNELWNEVVVYLSNCESTLVSARAYLEDVSILVSLGGLIKEIVKEIKKSVQIIGIEIRGLLTAGK